MKKFTSLLTMIALTASLAACGGTTSTSTGTSVSRDIGTEASETASSAAVLVDEKILTVDVTLAASFFSNMTEEEIQADAKEKGYNNCTINDDGSVTYTMSKQKHQEMLDDMKSTFGETVDSYLNGEKKVESFVDIQANDDFSNIDVYVDASKYTSLDNMYAWGFYYTGIFYQMFNGVADDDLDVIVNFIDNETKETLSISSYKEYINQINASKNAEESSVSEK